MTLHEIIAQFDTLSNRSFSEHHIGSELRKLIPENKEEISPELLSELMAFDFQENYTHKNGWGTYYGPMLVWNNGDGSTSESPSIKQITPEMIAYWDKRAHESKNPILISRYSGLIWEFHHRLPRLKPPHKICIICINAIIEIANGDFHQFETIVFDKLARGLSLALSLNNNELIAKCKNALINYEKRHSQDTQLGLWGYSFDLLLMGNRNIILTDAEENDIINELENKIQRQLNIQEGEQKADVWAVEAAARRLAKYYRNKQKELEAKRVILEVGKAYENNLVEATSLQKAHGYEHLHKLYTENKLKEEADAVLLKLRESGPEATLELGRVTHTHELDDIAFDKYLNDMTYGSIRQVLSRFVIMNIPIVEAEKEEVLNLSRMYPMIHLFPRQNIDKKGRIISKLASVENDLEGHIIDHIAQDLSFASLFLRELIKRIISMFEFNKNEVLNFIKDTPVISKERKGIIERGLEAYFAGDHLVAIHLIIPQIEEAIRNIVEAGGGNVMKLSKNGTYQLRTFDDILRDDIFTKSVGENFATYFRVLFTDPRGWNLRNDVCHGMAEIEAFNSQTADRVLHALLCLGLLVKKNTDSKETVKE